MFSIEEAQEDILKNITPVSSNEMVAYARRCKYEPKVITVKFNTLDDEVFTQSYSETMDIKEIKEILQQVFCTPVTNIVLSLDGRALEDNEGLITFDWGDYYTLEFVLASKDPSLFISAKNAYKNLTIPDIITVTVTYEDGSSKDVVVEIFNQPIVKPDLGGYLHKATMIEYHHGYTQTGPPIQKVPPERKSHRDTQTYWTRNRKNDTVYSQATQMSRTDVYIPNVTDKLLTPGPYETADEREERLDIEGKVRTIQRYYRAYRIRCALKVLRKEYHKRLGKEQEEEEYLVQMDLERKNRELIGKVFPRTKGDFCMLYTMLENWKKAEIERIKNMACGPSKIAEMYLLLEKEIQMLLSIEKQKEIVKKDRKIQKEIDFLKSISEPLSWNSEYHNLYIEMDTLEVQKGREYFELYKAICDNTTGREGRLKAYLDVKATLEGHNNCEVGLEIYNLIERACLLMARGISNDHLEILHRRIEACILRHLRMNECCEGVAVRQTRVKEKLMHNDVFFCIQCKNFKRHTEFNITITTKCLNVCKSCEWNDRVREPWMDIQPYRFMLQCIRREERRKSSHSSIAFIMTDKDIYHIVTQIWQSHSAINECDDIYKLRLCRFFADKDWAPWNCILLTNEEAKTHLKIPKLDKVYDSEFLHHIYNKHTLSKRYFSEAIELHNYFQEIGKIESRWDEIIVKKEFVAVNSKTKLFTRCH